MKCEDKRNVCVSTLRVNREREGGGHFQILKILKKDQVWSDENVLFLVLALAIQLHALKKLLS